MKLKNFTLGSALVLLLTLPLFTIGQTTRSIDFPKGKNVTLVNGTVKGRQYLDYRVTVQSGQILEVTLTSKNKSVYFNVLLPGSPDVAIYNSSTAENKFSRTADQSGLYTIRVYLMGAAKSENRTANFSLNVGILKPSDTGDVLVPGNTFSKNSDDLYIPVNAIYSFIYVTSRDNRGIRIA